MNVRLFGKMFNWYLTCINLNLHKIFRTPKGRCVNVVWTSNTCYGRIMVLLVTQEVATIVTWSWVRTAMTRRERCSDVLRSRRGRCKNFRNVGDASSSCIDVLAVLPASIMSSLRVPVAPLPFELSPYGVLTASFVRVRSHGVCLEQIITNAVAWRSGKFACVCITFVTRLKKF